MVRTSLRLGTRVRVQIEIDGEKNVMGMRIRTEKEL